jgi:PIN domain nuclease of toxin-antitoxin system
VKGNSLLLLDTHIWIWWIEEDRRLPPSIRDAIEDDSATIVVSAVSVYEVTVLVRRQRIQINRPVENWIERASQGADIGILQISFEIAQHAGQLPFHHGDPVDRIIIASTLHHDAYLASVDSHFPKYQELAGRLLGGKSA